MNPKLTLCQNWFATLNYTRRRMAYSAIGGVIFLILGMVYGFLVHTEILAARKLSRSIESNLPGIYFQYSRVGYNPVSLFMGDFTLFDVNITLLNGTQIKAKSLSIAQFSLTDKAVQHLGLTLEGTQLSHLPLKSHALANHIQRLRFNIALNYHPPFLALHTDIRQQQQSVLSNLIIFNAVPTYTLGESNAFISALASATVLSSATHVHWPLNMPAQRLTQNPSLLAALKQWAMPASHS